MIHWEKKLSHFGLKSWVTGGTKIQPGKVGYCRIFELIWLSMLSQFDSQCWVNLTLNVESIWLSMLSQFDSQCWVNLTHNVESIWLSMLSQKFLPSERILDMEWLHIFIQSESNFYHMLVSPFIVLVTQRVTLSLV